MTEIGLLNETKFRHEKCSTHKQAKIYQQIKIEFNSINEKLRTRYIKLWNFLKFNETRKFFKSFFLFQYHLRKKKKFYLGFSILLFITRSYVDGGDFSSMGI